MNSMFASKLSGVVRMKIWEIDKNVEAAIERLPHHFSTSEGKKHANVKLLLSRSAGLSLPPPTTPTAYLDSKIRSQITQVSQNLILPSVIEYNAMSLQLRNHIVEILDAIINSYKGNV